VAKKDRTKKQTTAVDKPGLLEKIGLVSARDDEKQMKATDLLKQDHKRVKELFSEFEKLEGKTSRRKEIVEEISRELEIHAQLEEKIFYQAFRGAREEEPKKIVRESFEEHKIVKTLLSELAGMSPSDEQYDAKVTVLKESVEHHVREEEGELFPAAEKKFSDEELERLGAEMENLKEEVQQTFERRGSSRARTTRGGKMSGKSRQRPAEA
jgi:hemerythrin superfamily protein